jgi:transcriptional regulator with XRE-family HTH domain
VQYDETHSREEERLFRVNLGKKIKEYRNQADLSQEKLAQRAGITRVYITRLEKGELNPSITAIRRIVKALDLSTSEFLSLLL